MPGTITPDNPRGYSLIPNGEGDIPRATSTSIKEISQDVDSLADGGAPLASDTVAGISRADFVPVDPADPQHANPVVPQNQILFFVTTDSSVTLRGRYSRNTTGVAQTTSASDSATTKKTKAAATWGIPAANLTLTAPTTRYVVAGLSGGSGNYDLNTGASGLPAYYIGGGSPKFLYSNGSTWFISASIYGTPLASNNSSDPTVGWPGSVTVTASTGGFSGVSFFIEVGGDYAGNNLAYFWPVGTNSVFYSFRRQQGKIFATVQSSTNGAHDRDIVDALAIRVDDATNPQWLLFVASQVLLPSARRVKLDTATVGRTITLPDAAALGASQDVDGGELIISNIGPASWNANCAGSDTFGDGVITSFAVNQGDTLRIRALLRADGSTWVHQLLS